jgi:nucleoside-diphosphate-sugar epimerase
MPTSTLVTGGAGFIGSSIVRAALAKGDRVRVVDNFFSGKRENLAEVAKDIELVEGDIRDEATLEKVLKGIEVVFHEAAIPSVPRSLVEPIANHEANATATLKLLFQAKKSGVRRVVYAASSSAYGDTPTLPKLESMRAAPLSPYAVSKLAGEHYCQVFATAYDLETVCLRYFNVFGARQDPKSEYAAVIPRFVTAALAGEGVTIYGDGEQSRDFCYIDNTVEANLQASTAPADKASGRVFNVACGAATTLNEVVKLISEITGKPLSAKYEPGRVGDVKHSLADIAEARTRLGYKGAISFRDGLERTIKWYAAKAAK